MITIANIDIIINILEEKFKNELPMSSKTEFELGKLVGNQEVVKYLKDIRSKQEHVNKKKANAGS